jgi:NADH-quinone oxidoreductase subunit L
MVEFAWLIPVLPLAGFVLNGLFGNKLPKSLVGIVGTGTILASFIISVGIFLGVKNGPLVQHTIEYFTFIEVGFLRIPFEFLIDPLSAMMLLVITGVGFLIHLYSISYMHDDESFARYFAYLNLFVFFMLLLVLGANYVIMFIGWEGVGLCSYLLIGFWFKNHQYNDAAKKAFIMNRIGDLGFLLGLFLMIVTFQSVSFDKVFSIAAYWPVGNVLIVAITLFLFVGATGKSAQIPLYTWLPDAMAGPTPVSALIHAATMVTAGIYMIIRSNVLYQLAPFTTDVILVIGLATALFAATIGMAQNDIKKVLAYSTVSQLGFMFIAIGLGAYTTAYFHVMTHAFFKALLFLGSGSVIHAMSGEQDIRKMGGLKKQLPITFFTFLIGTVAIAGIPPFAGFFSKDEILAKAFEHSPLIWGMAVLGAMMTSFYMFRLLFVTFLGSFRGTKSQADHLHESPLLMTIPLMVLAVLSTIGGFFNVPEVLGGSAWLGHFFHPVVNHLRQVPAHAAHLSHSTEYLLMGLSVAAALISIAIAYVVFVSKKTIPNHDGVYDSVLQKWFANKYYVDELYEGLVTKPLNLFSTALHRFVEVSGIDAFVNFIGQAVILKGKYVRYFQSGYTGVYLLSMVTGVIILILFNTLS